MDTPTHAESGSLEQDKRALAKERAKEAHAAYLRWQDVRRTQLGYVVNLVFTLTTASLAFGVKLIFDKPGLTASSTFYCSLWTLIAATGVAVLTNLSRLWDFRHTAFTVRGTELNERQKAGETLTPCQEETVKNRCKHRKKAEFFGGVTWWLLCLQLLTFVIGVGLLVCGVHRYSESARSSTSAGRFVNLSEEQAVLLDTATGEWCSAWYGEKAEPAKNKVRSCRVVK